MSYVDLSTIWKQVVDSKVLESKQITDTLQDITTFLTHPRMKSMLKHDLVTWKLIRKQPDNWWKSMPLFRLTAIVMEEDDETDKWEWETYQTMLKTKLDPTDYRWYCLPHMCEALNGSFLYDVLRQTFPNKTFQVKENSKHTWVVDEKEACYDISYFHEHLQPSLMTETKEE